MYRGFEGGEHEMIRIERDATSPYSPSLVEEGRFELGLYYASLKPAQREQRRNPVEKLLVRMIKPAREALLQAFHGKCAYCESAIGITADLEIDHFRPKSGATDLKGTASPDHYAWLTLEWLNHYASCPACNRAKRAIFPVEGARSEPMTPIEAVIENERAVIIDPCRDDPGQHFMFSADGTVRALTERGAATIKILNLNRAPLVIARKEAYSRTVAAIEASERSARVPTWQLLDQLLGDHPPYVAVIRQAFEERRIGPPNSRPDFGVPEERRSADEVILDADSFRLNARSIARVEIRNFKSLRTLDVTFAEQTGDAAPWLMLLGENAAGKTSVLHAIGLALAGAEEASRFMRPSKVLSIGADRGWVRLTFFDKEIPTELFFQRGSKSFEGTPRPSAVVIGFGALRYAESRRSKQSEHSATRFAKLAPLLEPVARIPHPAAWLLDLDAHRFGAAALALRELLPIGDESDIVKRGARILFKIGDHEATLNDLSAGYQTVVGMACAIMRMLFDRWENLLSASAIVLIDELDAHLHPRWKMRIVSSLRKAFPQVQFVASTHDPLVLRGVRNEEVAVLRLVPGQGTVVDQDLPPIEGMNVEDLLTSRHFGLDSLLDPEVEARLTELYHLRSLPQTKHTSERIAELRDNIGDREALGGNRRERIALLATDEFLRSAPAPEGMKDRRAVSEATLSRLQQLLDVSRTEKP